MVGYDDLFNIFNMYVSMCACMIVCTLIISQLNQTWKRPKVVQILPEILFWTEILGPSLAGQKPKLIYPMVGLDAALKKPWVGHAHS